MPLTQADAVTLAHSDGVINNKGGFAYREDSPDHVPPPAPADANPSISWDVAMQSIAGQARAANVNAAAALAEVRKLTAPITIPTPPAGSALSDADVARVAKAVADLLDARLAS